MKKIFKWSLIVTLITGGINLNECKAQLLAAQTAMQSLYKIYDSLPFITFDVKYTYSSDTLYNDFAHDEMTGTYTMNGKKAKFTMGDIEYMQNDSFFIAAFHKDKMIIVSNARQSNAGGYMPLRGAIDSLLNAYATHYTITVLNNTGDSIGYIRFVRSDSIAQFNNFTINFSKKRNCITNLTYDYSEQPVLPDSLMARPVMNKARHRTLKIDFIHYRFDNFSESVYDTNNYIWFEDGIGKSVAKLEGYKVYDARQ